MGGDRQHSALDNAKRQRRLPQHRRHLERDPSGTDRCAAGGFRGAGWVSSVLPFCRFPAAHPRTELCAAATDRATEISRLPDSVSEALPLERDESIQTAAVLDTQATVDTVQAESSWDAMQRQIRPEGMHSVVEYASIYENTDLKYDLTAEKLKESVIIRQKDEALLGYRYHLDSQGLRLL